MPDQVQRIRYLMQVCHAFSNLHGSLVLSSVLLSGGGNLFVLFIEVLGLSVGQLHLSTVFITLGVHLCLCVPLAAHVCLVRGWKALGLILAVPASLMLAFLPWVWLSIPARLADRALLSALKEDIWLYNPGELRIFRAKLLREKQNQRGIPGHQ